MSIASFAGASNRHRHELTLGDYHPSPTSAPTMGSDASGTRHSPPPLYRAQLSGRQLSALVAYENRGVDLSLTYRYLLSPLYDRLLPLVPARAAPNLVTLTGFLLALFGHLAVLLPAPTLRESAPFWASLSAGVGLALYMVLDNLDGRQARRTGSSSPLGHLFDHGCDALNVSLSAMTLAASLRVGPYGALAIALVGQGNLLAATLEELFTGAMVLREFNGPNEGLLMSISVHLVAAFWPRFWAKPPSFPVPVFLPAAWTATNGACFVQLGVFLTLIATVQSGIAIFRHIGLLRGMLSVMTRSTPLALYVVAYAAWAQLAPVSFEENVHVALWISAFFVFDLISRVIIVHLTNSAEYPYTPPLLLCALVPPTVALLAKGTDADGVSGAVPVVSALALVIAVAGAGWRAACIVEQLCAFLNIRCFRLGPRKAVKKEDEGEASIVSSVTNAGG